MQFVTEANNYKKFIKDNQGLFEKTKPILFEDLLKVYLNTEQLIGDNRDKLITQLKKIQEKIYLYETNQVNEFIKKTDYKILTVDDKVKLKNAIDCIVNKKNETIENIVNFADETNRMLCLKHYHWVYDKTQPGSFLLWNSRHKTSSASFQLHFFSLWSLQKDI
jgi:hypothetical protein